MRESTVLRVLGLCAALALSQSAMGQYFREPALHGDTLVFTAEGDLWTVAAGGGEARRLTTHAAEESQAAISPDGRSVAFVASYDSVAEVYVMPLAGGSPKRLSFDGGRVWVQGWTPQGEVLYATEAVSGPSWRRMLRAVHPDSLAERELPLADANEASFGDEGSVYFTRFGLHVTGDNARDYRGGAAAQLWRWRAGEPEATRLAPAATASLRQPMWWNGRLYHLDDQDGSADLWSMAPDGSDRRAHTRHADFEVRGPSLSQGRVAYQHGAGLRLLDLASGQDQALAIRLAGDRDPRRTRWIGEPLGYVTAASLAPDGRRVVLTARGRIALAGVGPLRRIEIATPPDSRAREALLSPDGRWVYAISDAGDASVGNGIWRWPADGSSGGEQLTEAGDAHRWRLSLSPDGRWLAHDDKRGRLWLLDTRTRRNLLVDDAGSRGAGDDAYSGLAWSADSRALAFVRPGGPRQINQLVLHDTASARQAVLTSDRYESFDPAFSPDGRWLYFLSNRHFQATPGAPWGDRNMGPMFDRRTRIYAIALQRDTRFPFQPPDELRPHGNGDDEGHQESEPDAVEPPPRIDWDGLASRLYEVPLAPGNYARLQVDDARLYYLATDAGADAKPRLQVLPINDQAPQPETFMVDVRAYALSADRAELWFMKWAEQGAGDMFIVPVGLKPPAPPEIGKHQVRVGDWALPVEPAKEWRQMFLDAWRMHRDFAFDSALRGQDWNAVRARYEPLVARLGDRHDLDDLLGQMVAELGILHSQVRGADLPSDPESAAAAALGAQLAPTDAGLRIARIWRTDPELPSERAPLQSPGVDAAEGDLLLSVNGRAVRTRADLARALHNQAGQQVLLELQRGDAAPHRAVVVPVDLGREATLRYGDWVAHTRAAVEAAGGGRIGYLHLRAMGRDDIAQFAREFYAQYDREGLVIDVRRNRGGNIDSWIIEKLLRRAWAFWKDDASTPYWNMQQAFRGHLVVLADNLTYSDGETFTAGIKALELGPVIGQRTAGAGIWLSDRNRLLDNGIARIAEFGQFGLDGRWLIEGHGVSPDIAVDNPPHATWKGEDHQLAAALAWLQQRLQAQPVPPLAPQPIPPRGEPGRDILDPPADAPAAPPVDMDPQPPAPAEDNPA